MSDDFKRPGQWANGTGIAQASEGSTAVVYIGPSLSEIVQAVSQALPARSSSDLIETGRLTVAPAQLVSAPPTKPEYPVARKQLLLRLEAALDTAHIAVLQGDVGSGRSELVRSYTENRPSIFWLDIEANRQLLPSLALELFLQNISDAIVSQAASASAYENIPASSILVIENISQAVADPGFLARVSQLVSTAKNKGYFVILSTIHSLPSPLGRAIPEVEVGRFSEEEVRELLCLYGAPELVVRSGLNNLVWGLTYGMPDLVEALLRSLSRRNWKLDNAAVDDLLHSRYSSELRADTQRLLLATESSDARELLYRLTLVNRAFSEDEVVEVARIKPPVAKPLELFHGLSGSWLQHEKQNRRRTSPLISGIGEANLERSTAVAVHSLVAHWVLKHKLINQYSAVEAITHLMMAERYNEAANILIQALHGLMQEPVDADAGLLLSLWKDLPLPDGIGRGLRLFIRGLQIVNALRRNQEYQFALDDLMALVASAANPVERSGAFVACSMVALQLLDHDPTTSLHLISLAVRSESHLPQEIRRIAGNHSAKEIFWVAAMKIDGEDAAYGWLTRVDELEPGQIVALMQAEFAPDSAVFMFDKLWLAEQARKSEERDWNRLLQFLNRCDELVAKWEHPLIAACILRARQAIRIVHTGEMDAASSDAENFYSENQQFASAVFLVAEGTAVWLIDIDRWDLASVWLTRAYPFQGPRLALYRQHNAIRYGEMLLRQGAPTEAPFEFAVALSEDNEDLTKLNHIQAKGELATFFYKTQQIEALYREWSDVVHEALKHRHGSKRWKHLFMLIANHTAYYSATIGRPRPPSKLVTEPALGMFIGDLRDLSDRYSEGAVFLQAGGMAWFADGLGKTKEAYEWALMAAELGAGVSRNSSAEHFLTQAIPFDIHEHQYARCVEHAIRAARGFASRQPLQLSEEVEAERQRTGVSEPTSINSDFSHFAPINLGLLPALIDIASHIDRNPEAARESILSILDVCRTQRENSDDPLMWDIATEALEGAIAGTLSLPDSTKHPSGASQLHTEERQILLTYGLWIQGNHAPRELWLAQGSIAPWISGFYRHLGGLGKTVCTSVGNMWIARIEQSAYLFRLPQYTIKRIKDAVADAHLGKILLVVAESLNINLGEKYQKGLNDCTMKRSA